MGFKSCTESPLAYHWHASESADLSLRQITHTGLGSFKFTTRIGFKDPSS
jgi:hypothetical protein